ncbi:hypothetical protein N7541_002297 [Penicillium brevicompactum]|uniref:Phytochrome n=1 Tax=Penicillium brevicompactum TaxID=5074 RepID=A0A9W9RPK9_PENBR|nr:hypothetical protein N7541_002297 [Penicillium brevicompactum]
MSSSNSRMTGLETLQQLEKLNNNPATESHSSGNESETADDAQEPSILSLRGSDRIFPIRSTVCVNPSASQAEPTSLHDSKPERGVDINGGTAEVLRESPSATTDINSCDNSSPRDLSSCPDHQPRDLSDEPYQYITARHEHVVTKDGHGVTVGQDRQILQRCEDEPIRIPGAVQSFGVIVALREESPDQLVVRVVSENSEHLMGYSPQQLFALRSFSDILPEEHVSTFTEHLDYVRDDGHDMDAEGPEVFLLPILPPSGDACRFWCAAHLSQENKDIIICEFELEEDHVNPLNVEDQLLGPTTPGATPTSEAPASFLGVKPTPTQFATSTVSSSQSLRALRHARRRKGEAAAMQIFDTISPIQKQLSLADDSEQLLQIAAGLIKELVGFHRVLVYQFDGDWNGQVVAELVDPQVTIDLFKGLHFPASDIPPQARELYRINRVRLLYDRDHPTSRLVCRSLEDLETPLDMTHSYLRAISPIHTRYLANMGVRSSMSISINAFGNLWGLVSCHSYGTAGMRVSFPIRKLCRLVGDTVARNIERIDHAAKLQIQKFANAIPKETNTANCIVASSDDLLRFLGADCGILSIGKEAKVLGRNLNADDSSQEMLALLEFLRARQVTSLLVSRDFAKDFPDFCFAPGTRKLSGVLCVPLSTSGDHFMVFFRRGQLTTVTWAGNPHEAAKHKQLATGGHLTPRQSFKKWSESLLSQSREWSASDLATATLLGTVYSKFIQVWNQKELMKQKSRFTRLLVANSAHEIRTPLNAIINYLELALESGLDAETREGLVKSHSASKSLIYVINDLLDLTTTADAQTSQKLVKEESFNLPSIVQDATNMLSGEAKRKGVAFSVSIHPGLPATAMGDQRRVRQVFLNLISNAIENTEQGYIKVAIYPSSTKNALAEHVAVEMSVTDTGSGISKLKRDKLFQELEQVTIDDYYSVDEAEGNLAHTVGQKEDVLGLGLAFTARIVHNMHGQLSLKSEEGKGSQFKILLQFRCPGESTASASLRNILNQDAKSSEPSNTSDAKSYTLLSAPHQNDGTVNLISVKPNDYSNPDRAGTSWEEAGHSPNSSQTPPKLSDSRNTPISPRSTSPKFTEDNVDPLQRDASASEPSSYLEDSGEMITDTITPLIPPNAGPSDSARSMTSARSSDPDAKLASQSQSARSGSSIPHLASETTGTSQDSSRIIPPATEPSSVSSGENLRVLVAEDDPINSQLVFKRLEKLGHTVLLTSNGEACFIAFSLNTQAYDVILMDIQVGPPNPVFTFLLIILIPQMPVVDGWSSIKMIRGLEAKTSGSESEAFVQPRHIPIFAVSASIVQSDKDIYMNHGFDGWIMKPINFTWLSELLRGVTNPQIRQDYRSNPRDWEGGGWFDNKEISVAL